jgi:DNA-directed RNA polymerase specialized sigma24 family protein
VAVTAGRWSLSEPAFARLLRALDADPEQAAARYEEMRRKLAKFFEWRGCAPADEHADEVLDRVARRLEEGVEVQNLPAYCYGIARLVVRESAARIERRRATLAGLEVPRAPTPEDDRTLTCLDRCLAALDPESRSLILSYYTGERRDLQRHRRALSERLGIAPNALRIRLHRVRRTLETCLMGCLDADGTETKRRSAPLPSEGPDA